MLKFINITTITFKPKRVEKVKNRKHLKCKRWSKLAQQGPWQKWWQSQRLLAFEEGMMRVHGLKGQTIPTKKLLIQPQLSQEDLLTSSLHPRLRSEQFKVYLKTAVSLWTKQPPRYPC
jgi:hypothetical protein